MSKGKKKEIGEPAVSQEELAKLREASEQADFGNPEEGSQPLFGGNPDEAASMIEEEKEQEALKEEAAPEEAPQEEILPEEPVEEAPAEEETPAEEPLEEVQPVEEAPAEETQPEEEPLQEEAPIEEPVEEIPAEEAKPEESPVEEPIEEEPTEVQAIEEPIEAPVEEPFEEEAAEEEAPEEPVEEEIPQEEAITEEAPVEEEKEEIPSIAPEILPEDEKGLRLEEVQETLMAELCALSSASDESGEFYRALRESKFTEISQILRLEKKDFDMTWIEKVEEGMTAIDKIVENPRQFIKQERDVIPAVKIKRISSESIQHLASHSHFVREVDEETGNVTPDKLLSVENEEDLAIYENRFVKTLILKLYTFVGMRYDYLLEHRDTKDSELLYLHNETHVQGVTYKVDSRIEASRFSQNEEDKKKEDAVRKRIFRIRDHLNFYMQSEFMNQLKSARPVIPPIAMTNMIVKNPNYHKAYLLWVFLDNYDQFGITFKVIEQKSDFPEEYLKQIYSLMELSILTMRSHDLNKDIKFTFTEKEKHIDPKILLDLDDELYLDDTFDYQAFKRYVVNEKKEGEAPYTQDEVKAIKQLHKERKAQEAQFQTLVSDYMAGLRIQQLEQEFLEEKEAIEAERRRQEILEKELFKRRREWELEKLRDEREYQEAQYKLRLAREMGLIKDEERGDRDVANRDLELESKAEAMKAKKEADKSPLNKKTFRAKPSKKVAPKPEKQKYLKIRKSEPASEAPEPEENKPAVKYLAGSRK